MNLNNKFSSGRQCLKKRKSIKSVYQDADYQHEMSKSLSNCSMKDENGDVNGIFNVTPNVILETTQTFHSNPFSINGPNLETKILEATFDSFNHPLLANK